MDVLALATTEHSWAGEAPAPAVEIRINERLLSDVITEVEQAADPGDGREWSSDVHPPGLWASFIAPWLDVPNDRDSGRWTPVLVCGCGDFPCGGFAVRISHDDGTVVWHDFIDAYSYALALWDPDVQYPQERRVASATIGPFRFDEKNYRHEIERVLATC